MQNNIVRLKNQVGIVKECKIGFSWTNLFFGFFVSIFRADWIQALIQLVVALVTGGISVFVFPFFYNKIYINNLLNNGYKPVADTDKKILNLKGFIVLEDVED